MRKNKQDKPIYKYIGNGHFVTGLPMRDLTASDLDKYDGELVESCGLYELVPSGGDKKQAKED